MSRRCAILSDNLEEQLIQKMKSAPSYSIQLDETTDVSSEAQLIVFCKFPDMEKETLSEHYLFCRPIGVHANAENIFGTINEYFTEKNIDWKKCKSVTTDGAAAMVGRVNGVIRKIQQVSSKECVPIHCILHREALVAKKMRGNQDCTELDECLNDVTKIINYIRGKPKAHRIFEQLCKGKNALSKKLVYYTEVRWLSRGTALNRVFELRKEVQCYLQQDNNSKSEKLSDVFWCAKLSYLAGIFDHLNKINISLQGKGKGIFECYSKINPFKSKLPLWKARVAEINFVDFPTLDKFVQENIVVFKDKFIGRIQKLISNHLDLLQDNMECYFSKERTAYLEENSWILCPFTVSHTENELLVDLRSDMHQKIFFTTMKYQDFWVKLWNMPDYKELAAQALEILVQIPCTYLCESGFSILTKVKSPTRNSIQEIDSVMRLAIEQELTPDFQGLATQLQSQISH